MKRITIIAATLVLGLSGCTSGWRPNIFTNLHNRIHGVPNVGEPCDGGCAVPSCNTCGGNVSNYGGYEVESPYSSAVSIGPSTYAGPRVEPVQAAPAR